MDDTKTLKDQQITYTEDIIKNLNQKTLPQISLPNQDGNLLKLNRHDTFRLVIYFYSLTGNPQKKLPKDWDKIPGASGCTLQNSIYRDNYDKFIKLNALPIGISTQEVSYIKEMTNRLCIQFDILSDANLICNKKMYVPTFSIESKIFFKRLTIVVEKNIIKKVFYPINSINKHVDEVLQWLEKN